MKILHIVLKVLLSLIILLPVVGVTGLLGEATRDLYNTDLAFSFIEMMNEVVYITIMIVVVNIITLIALWTKREALAALLILPISLNVVGFHLMIDGGLFTGGAVLANIMLLINLYLIWKNRESYAGLLKARN